MWEKVIIEGLAVYIIVVVISAGSIFDRAKRWLRPRTLFLITGGSWLFDCRLCLGMWVSLAVATICGDFYLFLPIYGFSTFIAKLEGR